ncbi:MAG: hypothetical protein ABIN91_19760 [Mucilaginibacter sp.]|uniref:hypothetical protein n=1 Tax=Mucilaginibacter sp. TaxID=1882438 RepID=UPI003264FD83
MKRILFIALVLSSSFGYAQQTVKRSSDINGIVFEKFTVLKTDKKIRQGEYTATFHGNVIAHGNYTNGQRSGEWTFYAPRGKKPIQIFNYDQNKFTLLDSADMRGPSYIIETTNPADIISAPVKIGGSSGIFALTTSRTELRGLTRGELPGAIKLILKHTLVISQTGQIVDHIVEVTGDNHMTKTLHLNDATFDPEITRFIPAMVNSQPVMSKVVIVTQSVTTGVITKTY